MAIDTVLPHHPPDDPVLDQFETTIAGRYYYRDAAAHPGEVVDFVREPANELDPNAVMVLNRSGEQIGYLPYSLAAALAPDLDIGAITLSGVLVDCSASPDGWDSRPPLQLNVHAANSGLLDPPPDEPGDSEDIPSAASVDDAAPGDRPSASVPCMTVPT